MKRIIAAILLGVCIGLGAHLNSLKLQALEFNPKDLPFYLEFYIRAFDRTSPQLFSINPEGENMLGYRGTDGASGLFDAVHLEPIKFLLGLVAKVSPTPNFIFSLHSLIFFLPLIYSLFASRRSADPTLVFLTTLTYILLPSFYASLTDNLRPFTYLVPVAGGFLLSLLFAAPVVVSALWFNLLLGIREESWILAIPIIVGIHFNEAIPRKLRNLLLYSFILWGVIYAYYFAASGYYTLEGVKGILIQTLGFGVLALAVFLVSTRIIRKFNDAHSLSIGVVLIVALMLLPYLGYYATSAKLTPTLLMRSSWRLIWHTRYHILLALPILLIPGIISRGVSPQTRRIVISALILLSIAGFSLDATNSHLGAPQIIQRQHAALPSTASLWRIRDELKGSREGILTDEISLPVFYGFQRVASFERLPVSDMPGRERFFPANIRRLRELILSGQFSVLVGERSQLNSLFSKVIEEPIPESGDSFIKINLQERAFPVDPPKP